MPPPLRQQSVGYLNSFDEARTYTIAILNPVTRWDAISVGRNEGIRVQGLSFICRYR